MTSHTSAVNVNKLTEIKSGTWLDIGPPTRTRQRPGFRLKVPKECSDPGARETAGLIVASSELQITGVQLWNDRKWKRFSVLNRHWF